MAEEPHARITHMDLLNLFNSKVDELRNDIRESRNEMRWMIGVGFALMLLFMAFGAFVR